VFFWAMLDKTGGRCGEWHYLKAGRRPKKATKVMREIVMTAIAKAWASAIVVVKLGCDATRPWRGRVFGTSSQLSPHVRSRLTVHETCRSK
jgi:hypothetical protein